MVNSWEQVWTNIFTWLNYISHRYSKATEGNRNILNRKLIKYQEGKDTFLEIFNLSNIEQEKEKLEDIDFEGNQSHVLVNFAVI